MSPRSVGRPTALRGSYITAALLLLSATFFSLPAGATVNTDNAPAPSKLVILGASYARSWGTPPLPGYSVVNRGVDGEQTKDMRARFQRDVVSVRPLAEPTGLVNEAREVLVSDHRSRPLRIHL
jgi:hypothetical protein